MTTPRTGSPFAQLARGTARELAVSAKTVRYDAATVVFGENDSAVDAYFIVDGQVDFDQAGERIRTLGPGMLFGEGPRCVRGLREPQRPPLRRAPCCCASRASRFAPL